AALRRKTHSPGGACELLIPQFCAFGEVSSISAAARAPPTAPNRTAPSSPPYWSRGLQRRCHSPAHWRSKGYSHLLTAQCPTDGLRLRRSRQPCWSSCRE